MERHVVQFFLTLCICRLHIRLGAVSRLSCCGAFFLGQHGQAFHQARQAAHPCAPESAPATLPDHLRLSMAANSATAACVRLARSSSSDAIVTPLSLALYVLAWLSRRRTAVSLHKPEPLTVGSPCARTKKGQLVWDEAGHYGSAVPPIVDAGLPKHATLAALSLT